MCLYLMQIGGIRSTTSTELLATLSMIITSDSTVPTAMQLEMAIFDLITTVHAQTIWGSTL